MTGPVLCAIDISDNEHDNTVIREAKKLADLAGVSLDVVTVVPDFGKSVVGSFFESDHHEKMVAASREALNTFVTATIGEEANKATRHIVATGSAYEEIIKLAEKAQSSLIVIGAHKPDFKDYLLGPNAARVVRHSNCSVYVVR
jgi:nucleotide-binding universal stress UspA family protein